MNPRRGVHIEGKRTPNFRNGSFWGEGGLVYGAPLRACPVSSRQLQACKETVLGPVQLAAASKGSLRAQLLPRYLPPFSPPPTWLLQTPVEGMERCPKCEASVGSIKH